MMERNDDIFSKFKKILVALDASPQSINALETAAKLASYMKASIKGLFVEDIDILRICESPFAREFSFFTFRTAPVQRERIEYQMRVLADKINRKIAEISSRLGISWDFTVTRGGVSSEILSQSEEADLVILGKSGWSSKGSVHLGSTAQDLIFKSNRDVLILGKRPPEGAPVFLFYFDTPVFRKALQLALFIKRKEMSPIVVLIPTQDINQGARVREFLKDELKKLSVDAYFRIIEVKDPSDFGYESSILKEGWFIVPYDRNLSTKEAIVYINL